MPWAQLWRCHGLVKPAAYLIIWIDMRVGVRDEGLQRHPELELAMKLTPGHGLESKLWSWSSAVSSGMWAPPSGGRARSLHATARSPRSHDLTS